MGSRELLWLIPNDNLAHGVTPWEGLHIMCD